MARLRARGGVLEREFALGVVIQLLAPMIEALTGRERERAFAGAAGLARPLFEDVPDRAAAEGRLFARFHGLHWLCARLAEQRPLALLVDDAHWADEQSLRFLDYLEARIEEIPACIVPMRGADGRDRGGLGGPGHADGSASRARRSGRRRSAPAAVAALVRGEPRRGRRGTRSAQRVRARRPGTRSSSASSSPRWTTSTETSTPRRSPPSARLGGALRGRATGAAPRRRSAPSRKRWRSSATTPPSPTPARSPGWTARRRRTRWTP